MLTSLLLAVLYPTLPVQQTQPGSGPTELSWGMAGDPTEPFRRTIVGDFDQSGMLDIVAVRGNQLDIVGDPATFGWTSGSLGSVRDAAYLWDPAQNRDTLVSVGWNGVQRWSSFELADAGTGASNPDKTLLDLAEPSAWVGAALVATGVVEFETQPRIVGCMADMLSVRTLRDSGSGYEDLALSLSHPPTENILDLALVDYMGDGAPELTVMTAHSLRVYELSSGIQMIAYNSSTGWSNACMTVGRPGPGEPEWVSLVINHPDGVKQYLTTVDADGPDGLLLLQGNPRVVAMTAGVYVDVDEPEPALDNIDLVLSINASNHLWVLLNDAEATDPPVFSLDPAHKLVVEYPSTSTGLQANHAQPALGDLDNDGTVDLLFPVRLTSALYVRLGAKQEELVPTVRPNAAAEGIVTPWIYSAADESLSLSVYIDPPEVVPSEATHLELAVFYKASISSQTERVSVWSGRFPLPLQQTPYVLGLPDHDPSPPEALPSGTPPPQANVARFENFFIVFSRYVKVQSGDVTRAYSGSFYGLQTSAFGDNLAYLQGFSPSTEVNCHFGGCPLCQEVETGDIVGTLTLLPTMPTLPEGPIVVQ